MKYRKKPVVIEAVRWDGTNIDEVLGFIDDFASLPDDGVHVGAGIGHTPALGTLDIPTLEGTMTASPGDWIIKGTQGELYPCKPAAFDDTFEPVEDGAA